MSGSDVTKFYDNQPLFAKIRCKICRCGEPIDWYDLKGKHDQVLKDYQEGKDSLPQTDT